MFFMAQNNVLTSNGPAYLGFLFLVALFMAREVRALARRRRSPALIEQSTQA
jgi:hypothetical protein